MTEPRDGAGPRLITSARRIEIARIVLVGAITLLFWQGVVTLPVLLGARL